jgi:DoxX-like family
VQPQSTVGSSRLRRTTYWIATIGLAWELGFGGLSDVMRFQYVRIIVTHLGYPLYVLAIIGVWKLLATIALLVPRFPLLKEWAYAGSFFVFSGAVASHIAAGDGFGHWIGPGIGAAVTAVSWALRPPSRRISGVSVQRSFG